MYIMIEKCTECNKELLKVTAWIGHFNYEKYIKNPCCEECFNDVCKFT